ncbi:hypothetical protein JX265_011657 [Neoarthrinium moseri]|uniref:Uncharacterized protein n=1 Tax=Neoarthrinium moseri TaxID=1658444 RepID=A0A9P9WC62_9PEZI|nr:hypothetical protein JX265_011657 [Neoarthrinium moseri]
MEALVAVGIVSNVVQFVDFATKLQRISNEIRHGAASAENRHHAAIATHMAELAQNIGARAQALEQGSGQIAEEKAVAVARWCVTAEERAIAWRSMTTGSEIQLHLSSRILDGRSPPKIWQSVDDRPKSTLQHLDELKIDIRNMQSSSNANPDTEQSSAHHYVTELRANQNELKTNVDHAISLINHSHASLANQIAHLGSLTTFLAATS